jgi:hypothetical protein
MLVELNAASPVAIYQQIVDEVERCLAVGILKPGEPLPAVRALDSSRSHSPSRATACTHRPARVPAAAMGRELPGPGFHLWHPARHQRAHRTFLAIQVVR